MIFSIGVVMVILGKLGTIFVDRWETDWRDYTVAAFISIGSTMVITSLLEFASRYLI